MRLEVGLFFAAIVTIAVACALKVVKDDQDQQFACRQSCDPYIGRLIDEACYCKSVGGWVARK